MNTIFSDGKEGLHVTSGYLESRAVWVRGITTLGVGYEIRWLNEIIWAQSLIS